MESVTSSQKQFEGLWMSCAATSLGSVQCSRFKTLLGLPGENDDQGKTSGKVIPAEIDFMTKELYSVRFSF